MANVLFKPRRAARNRKKGGKKGKNAAAPVFARALRLFYCSTVLLVCFVFSKAAMRTFVSCMHLYTHDALNFSWFPFFSPLLISLSTAEKKNKQTNKTEQTKRRNASDTGRKERCAGLISSLCAVFFFCI